MLCFAIGLIALVLMVVSVGGTVLADRRSQAVLEAKDKEIARLRQQVRHYQRLCGVRLRETAQNGKAEE